MTESRTAASNEASPAPRYDRRNPFLSELLVHRPLTGKGSAKDTRHYEFSLAGSGLSYKPGDSLAVIGRNPLPLVDSLLQRLGLDGDATVTGRDGKPAAFRRVLERDYVLNRAGAKLLKRLPDLLPEGEQQQRVRSLVEDKSAMAEYLFTRDFIDVLAEYDAATFETPEQFIECLSPVPPRLYSIASSIDVHPEEVHLCVGIVRYTTHGRTKSGFCTGYLADLVRLHVPDIPVYIQASKSFHLPEDNSRDIIMVGPGTGVAPFRAFLEQRRREGASGRNWLIFGEQHRATDYLYQEEWEACQGEGVLHRLDLAFSRDQAHKIYVQHRMKEQAAELWSWLQNGAYFYVCGDARRMAKDVHQTLIDIAREQGGLSEEDAGDYVNKTLMKTEKRYLRDVY